MSKSSMLAAMVVLLIVVASAVLADVELAVPPVWVNPDGANAYGYSHLLQIPEYG